MHLRAASQNEIKSRVRRRAETVHTPPPISNKNMSWYRNFLTFNALSLIEDLKGPPFKESNLKS